MKKTNATGTGASRKAQRSSWIKGQWDGLRRDKVGPEPTKSEAQDFTASQQQVAAGGFARAFHTGLRPVNQPLRRPRSQEGPPILLDSPLNISQSWGNYSAAKDNPKS